jgi:hypothetical protein
MEGVSPIQQQMLEILSDGLPHLRSELHTCCGPSSEKGTVSWHVHRIRQFLKPKGEAIICVLHHNRIHYQHVRLLYNPYDGRR